MMRHFSPNLGPSLSAVCPSCNTYFWGANIKTVYADTTLLTWPVLHITCVRYASVKHCLSVQYSYMLAELFRKPVIIAHHRGHVVPGLDEERLEQLRSFLRARMHDSSL